MYDLTHTFELTEEELTAVTGDGGAFLGACGCALGGFAFTPFITAFSNANAVQFAASQAVQESAVNQNAYFTQWA
jgi:hypothetical protein